MACSTCAAIPGALTANTRRDEWLPPATRALERLGLNSREDLWACRECGALYLWEDLSSWTGSGNNDEETLRRITAAQLPVVRRFLGREDAGDMTVLADALFALPRTVSDLLLVHAYHRERAMVRAIAPRLVAELARRDGLEGYGLRDLLSGLVEKDPDEARRVLAAIEATQARPYLLAQVAERCREAIAGA